MIHNRELAISKFSSAQYQKASSLKFRAHISFIEWKSVCNAIELNISVVGFQFHFQCVLLNLWSGKWQQFNSQWKNRWLRLDLRISYDKKVNLMGGSAFTYLFAHGGR